MLNVQGAIKCWTNPLRVLIIRLRSINSAADLVGVELLLAASGVQALRRNAFTFPVLRACEGEDWRPSEETDFQQKEMSKHSASAQIIYIAGSLRQLWLQSDAAINWLDRQPDKGNKELIIIENQPTLSLIDGGFPIDVGFLRSWKQEKKGSWWQIAKGIFRKERRIIWISSFIPSHQISCAFTVFLTIKLTAQVINWYSRGGAAHPDDLTDVLRGCLIQLHGLSAAKRSRWLRNNEEGGEQLKGGKRRETWKWQECISQPSFGGAFRAITQLWGLDKHLNYMPRETQNSLSYNLE